MAYAPFTFLFYVLRLQDFESPRMRDFAELNLHLPAEVSAQAGAFLSSLDKTTFSAAC
jgi:hypothetical protein